jgi:CRP-like cAMP-binding protein
MVSPELLRRYPFFAGLSHDQLVALAMTADELDVSAEHRFFREGDELNSFYFVVEGDVDVVFEVPASGVQQSVAGQLTGNLETVDIVISHVGPGEPFGWSALAGAGDATAGAVAQVDSKVVAFDVERVHSKFEEDPYLHVAMLRQALHSVRDRLHDLRVECLSHL